ncbi:MAG: cobyrinate a,c-diamide synthase [Thiotrichales bacterium]|jgi:cobyrinic acid a,c-diamide synthase|nr:cobyrinate a,c-diamide synthase [Thiotrichales bacterium]
MPKPTQALFIAAPASGQGKTTITAGLAYYYRQQGKRVRVFKTGPDFIDPMLHQLASGHPVYQLDLWMGGEAHCRQLLADAAQDADIILIEGVMGLFDGAPSSADLARLLGVPILVVIDASSMAQTFGALAHGLATYQDDLPFFGILANRVGSDIHADMIRDSVRVDTPLVGIIKRDVAANLPERHLGLVQATEIDDIEQRIAAMSNQIQLTALSDFDQLPKVNFQNTPASSIAKQLQGKTIAIAKDAAFSFLYQANIDCLQQLGATLCYFSPLADDPLPSCDAVYLPGGYPELYLNTLAAASNTQQTLSTHVALGKPLLAECGGMLALLAKLTDKHGKTASMWALLPGEAIMQPRFVALGMQSVDLGDGALRGHTFHYSKLNTSLSPIAKGSNPHGKGVSEAVYQLGSITASYIHSYFPSNPTAVAKLFS